jgi:hypothetical protein
MKWDIAHVHCGVTTTGALDENPEVRKLCALGWEPFAVEPIRVNSGIRVWLKMSAPKRAKVRK